MNRLLENVAGLVLLLAWLAGIVLANGFWSTLGAITVPPYALYLVVEMAMRLWGLL